MFNYIQELEEELWESRVKSKVMTNARKAIIKQLSIGKTVPKDDSDNNDSSNLPTPKAFDDRDTLRKLIKDCGDINLWLKKEVVDLKYEIQKMSWEKYQLKSTVQSTLEES